jgi:hypothetical protein
VTIEQTLEDKVGFGKLSILRQKPLPPAGPEQVSQGYAVEELWYKLLARPWSSLVVVSPDRTPKTLRLARSLAEFGTQHRRRPVEIIDGLQLDLERSAAIAQMMEPEGGAPRLSDPRFVVALDSPIANPIAIEVLTACDAVLILLEKGVTRIHQARKIIEIAGRERLIGAVLAVE